MQVEIASAFRDRNLYPDPCSFNVSVNVPSKNFANAGDPVSLEYPVGGFAGYTLDAAIPNVLSLTGTVLVSCSNVIECVFSGSTTLFDTQGYYTGVLINGNVRVDNYDIVSANVGRFYVNRNVSVGSAVTLNYPETSALWNGSQQVRMFVPAKKRNSYVFVVNESRRGSVRIEANESGPFVRFTPPTGAGWQPTDYYSFCDSPPCQWAVLTSPAPVGATQISLSAVNIPEECFIKIASYTGRVVRVVNSVTINVFPPVQTVLNAGALVLFARFSYDNVQSLQYVGTSPQDQRAWNAELVNLRLPNVTLSGNLQPSLLDYPNLYLEFADAHSAPQNNIMSNNRNGTASVFRVTPDETSRHSDAYVSYTCDGGPKSIRFSPTAREFTVRVSTPEGNTVSFAESDSKWPAKPYQHLQINMLFNLVRTSQSITVQQ